MDAEDYLATLRKLDLGPLDVEVEAVAPDESADLYLRLRWGGQRKLFVVEFKKARALRDLRQAAWQAKQREMESPERPLLLLVPYLNDDALRLLHEEGVSGLDLSGNGLIEVPGQWRFFQRGFPSRFPTQRKSRAPYRGKSALVGRVLLARPRYRLVGEVKEEIQRRGGSLSMSQVSKVLAALEDDLIIEKTEEEIRLLQPAKLLDALVDGYELPGSKQVVEATMAPPPMLYAKLLSRSEALRSEVVGYDPQQYAIAPTAREKLEVYVRLREGLDLADAFGVKPTTRFSNLVLRAVDAPGVFFDLNGADGFRWCSRLEVYLQLMKGGKRERETAEQLRSELIAGATTK